MAGFGLAFLLACGDREPTSVLLIVSDTFRADAIDCERAPDRTPNLCALAASGARFDRAYTSAPWTLPAVAGMMGGSSPAVYARPKADDPSALRFRVPDRDTLLAEALVARGYEAWRTIENSVASHANGLQGMEPWLLPKAAAKPLDPRIAFDGSIRRHQKMIPALLDLVEARPAPFFGLYWFRDPHAPYRPPQKHFATLAEVELPRPAGFYLGLGHGSFPSREERKLRPLVGSLIPEELAYLRRLYETEVRSIDERVGNLLAALELSGRRARTLVIFTSDHGEAFGEHGYYLHGETFHEELVRVPLLVAGPGIPPGRRIETPVSLLDLMPTLAERLGVECLDRPQGQSLWPLLSGRSSARLEARALYIVNPIREPGADAVVWGRYKLIALESDASLALFDLVADPGETVNLASREPAVVERLLRFARAMREENDQRRLEIAAADGGRGEALSAEDEKTLRDLKAIGYLE